MELKLNILRDAMLDIEELHKYPKVLRITDNNSLNRCKKYDFNEVLYHFRLLKQADYIDWHPRFASNKFHQGLSSGITFEGHEFINTIRGDKVWKKTQSIIGKVGSFSIDIVKDVSSQVLAEIIKSQL